MKKEWISLQTDPPRAETGKTIPLFAGIELEYLSFTDGALSICRRKSRPSMIIHYCRDGRIGWKTGQDDSFYLEAGDFSVQTPDFSDSTNVILPTDSYKGLALYIDLKNFSENPPDILDGTGITGASLYEKLCRKDSFLPFTGNAQTDSIFRFFFEQPEPLQTAYQKIKTAELLLYLYHGETLPCQHAASADCPKDQLEVIRQIHEDLLSSLDRRITIEELSKQYLMNPTTMKALFKSVYGTSIAAHMKEHRMRQAARLLLESEMSIAEIALSVGYDSQSKFSTAFKEFFQMLPKEYRKKR